MRLKGFETTALTCGDCIALRCFPENTRAGFSPSLCWVILLSMTKPQKDRARQQVEAARLLNSVTLLFNENLGPSETFYVHIHIYVICHSFLCLFSAAALLNLTQNKV